MKGFKMKPTYSQLEKELCTSKDLLGKAGEAFDKIDNLQERSHVLMGDDCNCISHKVRRIIYEAKTILKESGIE